MGEDAWSQPTRELERPRLASLIQRSLRKTRPLQPEAKALVAGTIPIDRDAEVEVVIDVASRPIVLARPARPAPRAPVYPPHPGSPTLLRIACALAILGTIALGVVLAAA
ncbi:MAG TPA: hypothetical protein VLX92_12335 [Kofleriaceae bacterium]|nr:hypothetical protein [Kofleriaceae bacterium]